MFEQKPDKKDIQALAIRYVRHWHYFAVGLAVTVAIALVYLRYATPQYMATTTLLFKGEDSGGGISENTAFADLELLNSNRSIDNEMLILKSQSLMEEVVTALQLDTRYVIEGNIRDVEIYGDEVPINIVMNELQEAAFGKSFEIFFKDDRSFELRDDGRTVYNFGEEIEKSYGKFTIVANSDFTLTANNKPIRVRFGDKKALAKALADRVAVKPVNNKASVLAISIVDPSERKAVDILRQVIVAYEAANVNDKNQIARKTVDFIDDRLDFLTQELNKVEQNVETFKQDREITDVTSQAQEYVNTASANRKELEQITIQLAVLRSIEEYVQAQSGDQYQIVPSTLTISDQTLTGLISNFNALQLDRERILRTNQPNNPLVININEQLSRLRVNIIENLKNIKTSLTITRRNLLAKSGMVGNQIQQVPVMERQLIEITRQQEIKQALYLYLLQKKEESALSLAATVSNTRIVDPPISKGKVAPNKTNTIAYASILGLFLAFLVVYARHMFMNKVLYRSEVERLTPMPILGEICHNPEQEIVVTGNNQRTPIAELFRLLRSNLHFAVLKKKNQVLLVTSSESGDGKTFFSINLAHSLAETGKKVVLIEFDLRRPNLLQSLQIEKRKGITDFLIGDIPKIEHVIFQAETNKNLFLISAGTLPPNPSEILLQDSTAQLIEKLSSEYDYVILDTPPVGKVADALNLSEHVDLSIYIVRYNYTNKNRFSIINDLYDHKKLNNAFLVLNDSKKANSGGYSYGY